MGRNVEIKARSRDFQKQRLQAEALSTEPAQHLIQEDTFFNISAGRLKLRIFENGSGELIQYDRDDSPGPKESRYVFFRTKEPEALKTVLTKALGIRAVVRKKRTVYFCQQTRIHLDQVDGRFIYALETGKGVIGAFLISGDGRLTALEEVAAGAPSSGFQGIATF